MSALPDRIDIRVTTQQTLHDELEAAVRDLQEAALEEAVLQTRTRGILIRCHESGHYSAELSDQVPFGITRESIH